MRTQTAAILIYALGGVLPSGATEVPVNGFPSPWGSGGPGWDEAYEKARAFVSQLTLVEKVNLTTGTGWESDVCVGMTGSVPRLGFRGICTQDGPLGVRYSELLPLFLGL
jgi:beta-glucosidase